ncbi:branched-chain amino acid transport system II carrier protein [Pseudomonas sp. CM25]|uniref:branched-chain amino acid transport system II carrier protein n=1 Tax=Pseudomonas sp. CM25 TaxID=2738448 RepID=UPI00155303CF|nr:branched-chain amino acid transport system II carrier protein [Pseudomonas sp. CM25]NQD57231.1 branched-chain amino acid transport system II carrier protein [Pseudomonas sp. CM25]
MNGTITARTFLALSFFLFSMFLGAGNIIFAPPLGQAAGTNTWLAMSGFLITGVGLVFLAILALSIAGGSIDTLSSRVSPGFAKFFSMLLFLTLGPIYVVPRTAAVVYEVSVTPFVTESLKVSNWPLMAFSAVFLGVTLFLSLDPKKFVDRIGSVLTPTFIILLTIIVITSIVWPIGDFSAPTGEYVENAFSLGFTQGYYTMDVLAAFVFGKIFLDAAKGSGVGSHQLSKLFVRAGLVAVVGLACVQLSLAGMGASSFAVLGLSSNGGQALTQIVDLLLGQTGVVMLAVIIMLTGLTTAVACLASVAEYFSRVFPAVGYKPWAVLLTALSLLITNFGLTSILHLASPILLFLYPIAITLIALVFLNRLFGGHQSVYIGAVLGAGLMGAIDALKAFELVPAATDAFLASVVPLYSNGLGWIIVATLFGLLGCAAISLRSGHVFQNAPVD